MTRYIVGVDEAGRGALAGPVAVGVFAVKKEAMSGLFGWLTDKPCKVGDSKMLTAREREATLAAIVEREALGLCSFRVAFVGPAVIDKHGITEAVRRGIRSALTGIAIAPAECTILLDGLLRAPRRFTKQYTIVRGDESEPAISLASIAAKVTRDRNMVRMAGQYPDYGFEKHKGYGTREHFARLSEYGMCGIHRRRYIKVFIL
jgi:ribonuclease HII